ncbi:MAG: hypothetical protein D8B50_06685 [Prevotella sp.]|nr:hypothetical protein [Prevotella sp.]RKW49371.1 MAG: hypothetical protein D8B50_06685 [Prevotella sp.]
MARGICADCDEHLFVLRIICGTSANDAHFCMLLAEVPQATCSFVLYLRKFRKQNAVFEHICGSSANVVQRKKRLKSEWANLVACAWDVWRVIAGLLRGNDDENKCVARGFWVDIEP